MHTLPKRLTVGKGREYTSGHTGEYTVTQDLKTKARDAIIPISKVLILAAFWPYCEWKADR